MNRITYQFLILYLASPPHLHVKGLGVAYTLIYLFIFNPVARNIIQCAFSDTLRAEVGGWMSNSLQGLTLQSELKD